jgi:hypothetical protein
MKLREKRGRILIRLVVLPDVPELEILSGPGLRLGRDLSELRETHVLGTLTFLTLFR